MAAAKKAPNPIDKHVGSRVRMRRMMLAMSQEKLGDALGLTFQQVQKYEKGTNRIGASRLQQISHILQVPVAFFFEGAPNLHGSADGGMKEAPSPAYVSDFLATSEGLSLTKAFMRIKEPKLRRRIVDLVEEIAGDEDDSADRRRDWRRRRAARLVRRPTLGPHLDRVRGRCNKHSAPKSREGLQSSLRGECLQCHMPIISLPASPSPKVILTRSATRFRMRSSMRSSRTTSSSASPTTAWSIRGSAVRRSAPPTRSSSPVRAVARRRCSANMATTPWSTAS